MIVYLYIHEIYISTLYIHNILCSYHHIYAYIHYTVSSYIHVCDLEYTYSYIHDRVHTYSYVHEVVHIHDKIYTHLWPSICIQLCTPVILYKGGICTLTVTSIFSKMNGLDLLLKTLSGADVQHTCFLRIVCEQRSRHVLWACTTSSPWCAVARLWEVSTPCWNL